jgi:hypothetical protein
VGRSLLQLELTMSLPSHLQALLQQQAAQGQR